MTRAALTLDAGALIAYEKAKHSIRIVLRAAFAEKRTVVVPAVVVAEVWRGGPRSARIAQLLQGCHVDPLFDEHARRVGEALRHVRGTTIDAIVVATAARYGTHVVTTDPGDLEGLAEHFGGLTVVAV